MGSSKDTEELQSPLSDEVQLELDRRIFHLKTLNDISRDIYGSVHSETILQNFLLAAMGNFGVMAGFILLMDPSAQESSRMFSIGLDDEFDPFLWEEARGNVGGHEQGASTGHLTSTIECLIPFCVEEQCHGLLGMGPKLIGEPYSDHDRELLDTLVNSLGVALKNARSYEQILQLNEDLREKNVQLQAAIRKVEILESVKANLSKFVPATVCSIIEKSPTGEMPETREQDVSVLFVDIEGYTRLCEKLGNTMVGEVVEKCFSMFMDAIYANNGDVNETAGDGLMVLFLDEDRRTNALQAVRAAIRVREEAEKLAEMFSGLSERLAVNMGINSGTALVGAAKFNSYTGSRWTYTARGSTTNLAARLGAFATRGQVCISKTTAERVKGELPIAFLGSHQLKNVTGETEIYAL
jgi:class 3 adenylate cyclase